MTNPMDNLNHYNPANSRCQDFLIGLQYSRYHLADYTGNFPGDKAEKDGFDAKFAGIYWLSAVLIVPSSKP